MTRCALIFIVFTFAFIKISVAQKLAFSYDASGNQTERRWICINCPSARQMATEKKTLIGQNPELNSDGIETKNGIKAYPNPLKETLNVSWGLPEKIYLRSLEVFSMGGSSVSRKSYNQDERHATISFQHLPPGTYLLIARYSDSRTETIKLVKL